MTDMFLNKDQRELLTNFGSSMDKMNTMMTEALKILDTVNSIAANTTNILVKAEESEAKLKSRASEEIEKLHKKIKAMENKLSYERRKNKNSPQEDFEV